MQAKRLIIATSLMVIVLLGWHWGNTTIQGCATVRRMEASVEIAEESAIILWEQASKTEHFIRWASFAADAADFGFLVPTPAKPLLIEAGDHAFAFLEELIKPRVVQHFEIASCCISSVSCSKKEEKKSEAKSEVRILHEQRVGGFDAVIVEADSAEALNEWLNHYSYVANPELTEWLEPYVKNNWKITAFRIVQDPRTGKPVKTAPVRMSFNAEKPFFPYREPKTKQSKDIPRRSPYSFNRLLRIFFLSEQKVAGRLGEELWPARVFWADQLENSQSKQLAKELGFKENNPLPNGAWLTTFHDYSEARPGNDDVYFEPAATQESVRPADIVQPIVIPGELILAGLILLLILIRRKSKHWGKNKELRGPSFP